jgi:hypothetical protein
MNDDERPFLTIISDSEFEACSLKLTDGLVYLKLRLHDRLLPFLFFSFSPDGSESKSPLGSLP